MKTVAVLMSTYNGEKFLKEQIDSILNQADVDVTLYIRDDGSSDSTVEIIDRYLENGSRIHFIEGENLGVGNSFMKLIYQVPQDYDFYAFADQDDVWLPGKLALAAERIGETEEPVLYTSNQTITDENLNVAGKRYDRPPDTGYRQILCQNRLSGCTMVWNPPLQKILSDAKRRPSEALLHQRIHDVWVAMTAAVTGTITFDEDSAILYRQHLDNVVGVRKTSLLSQWKMKLLDPSQRNGRSELCREIWERENDLIKDPRIREDLSVMGGYRSSLQKLFRLLKDPGLTRHSGETVLGYRMKVLLQLF